MAAWNWLLQGLAGLAAGPSQQGWCEEQRRGPSRRDHPCAGEGVQGRRQRSSAARRVLLTSDRQPLSAQARKLYSFRRLGGPAEVATQAAAFGLLGAVRVVWVRDRKRGEEGANESPDTSCAPCLLLLGWRQGPPRPGASALCARACCCSAATVRRAQSHTAWYLIQQYL